MPQITTAFDFVTTMRWALDAASDRVPVTSRTPATKAKMAQRIVRSAASRTRTSLWRWRWPKAWCPRFSVVALLRTLLGSLTRHTGHLVITRRS
jgi:hypothetical protein